jgi:hypothetical protein
MEEPWTLVVVAMCACMVVCVLLFTIIRCCLCSYKGMKIHQMDSVRYIIPFDYRPNVVITVNETNPSASSAEAAQQCSTSTNENIAKLSSKGAVQRLCSYL